MVLGKEFLLWVAFDGAAKEFAMPGTQKCDLFVRVLSVCVAWPF